jgi:hypothetical protein
MVEHRTAEESKDANVIAMGEELGLLYSALWQQVAALHHKWAQYVVLFGTKESRVKLLNAAAGQFFRVVQDTLWEDTVLHIARLTDSPASVGRPNLSIRRLPGLIDDLPTKHAVTARVEEALEASEFCRDWRNRHIAHRDLELALKRGPNPLKPGSREKVRKAMEALEAVLNTVAEHYLESSTSFSLGSTAGGALSLLHLLDDGLKAEKARKERIKAGKTMPGDLDRHDI